MNLQWCHVHGSPIHVVKFCHATFLSFSFTFSSSLMQPAPASRREVEQEMEVLEIMFEVMEIAEMSHER